MSNAIWKPATSPSPSSPSSALAAINLLNNAALVLPGCACGSLNHLQWVDVQEGRRARVCAREARTSLEHGLPERPPLGTAGAFADPLR